MRCRHCDHENERAANFCSSCGESLEDDETTVALELVEDRRILEEELGDVLEQLPPGMGLLVVRRGPISGSTFVLDAETVALGRHPHSDIFAPPDTTSPMPDLSTAPTSTTNAPRAHRCTT
jgi:hypothetical protein